MVGDMTSSFDGLVSVFLFASVEGVGRYCMKTGRAFGFGGTCRVWFIGFAWCWAGISKNVSLDTITRQRDDLTTSASIS